MNSELFATYCQNNLNCTIENVDVTCGNVTIGARRRRRSAISELIPSKLMRDNDAYKQRQQKVIFHESTTSLFSSRRRRNTHLQFEVKIYFDLLADIPQGSDENFEEDVYTTEGSLYDLSDEIARTVENGDLIPQVLHTSYRSRTCSIYVHFLFWIRK